MARSEAEERHEALKRQILALGWARPGSLIRRYMPCGKWDRWGTRACKDALVQAR